jgi:hypothetical protein
MRLSAVFAFLGCACATPAKSWSTLPTAERYALFNRLAARLEAGETPRQLEDAVPHLEENLATAARVSAERWTDSTTFDELAKAEIASTRLLDQLGVRRTVTAGVTHVPAGVMHTYGYLFAQLQTAFGLKGKRWIESRVDERLGLAANAFSPFAPSGEFLSNVTAALDPLTQASSTPRLTEEIDWRTPDGSGVHGTVRTFLVPLRPLDGSTDVALLIYTLQLDGKQRLVTAFPVGETFAQQLRATPAAAGDAFMPRFNLYVDPSWQVTRAQCLGFAGGQ